MKLEHRLQDIEKQNRRLHEDNMRVYNMAKRAEQSRNSEQYTISEELDGIYKIFGAVTERFKYLEDEQESMLDDYRKLQDSYEELKAEYSSLKTAAKTLIKMNSELQSQYDELRTLQETQYEEIKNILTNVWGKCIDTESVVLDQLVDKIEDLEFDVEAIWSEKERTKRPKPEA
jgi:cyclophilin family peptidyl-prolyl cis-trans isomerase